MGPFQAGFESILLLLPLILCCLLAGMRRQQAPTRILESDLWYLKVGVAEAWDAIKNNVNGWVRVEEQVVERPGRLSLFGDRGPSGFRILESVPPRLLRLFSGREGEISFELTEVEGGGTSVKALYTPEARPRLQSLKARLPLIAHVFKRCERCGNPTFANFSYCPHCGTRLY